MANIIPGESIWFNRYESTQYVEYQAICRVAPASNHDELNLSWFDEDGIESQANNVKNIEDTTLGSTESYWRRRYSSIDMSWLRGLLETVRVEKGGMILWREWDTGEGCWCGGRFAVIVATLGVPTEEHPGVNLKYVNDSGTTITVSAIDPIEGYTDEDDAEGNDLWSNIPDEIV